MHSQHVSIALAAGCLFWHHSTETLLSSNLLSFSLLAVAGSAVERCAKCVPAAPTVRCCEYSVGRTNSAVESCFDSRVLVGEHTQVLCEQCPCCLLTAACQRALPRTQSRDKAVMHWGKTLRFSLPSGPSHLLSLRESTLVSVEHAPSMTPFLLGVISF